MSDDRTEGPGVAERADDARALVRLARVGDARGVTAPVRVGDGALARGTQIGDRYVVEAEIGAGAMGRVYRVVHRELQLPLALKILHPELAVVSEVRERILREAQLSAWLDHPSVVQVTDYGTHAGRPYLVMRLVDGELLSLRLERGAVSPREVVDLGEALCEGLAHAHGRGLVHRDLKPDNIVLTARGLRILDFGLARAIASDDPRLTRTGLVCGTPRYMSPEQASGDEVDVRSDIYAVGVLLHEMLRGAPMFDGPNAAAVLRKQIVETPPRLELPKDRYVDTARLASVVERALSKEAAIRHGDALALAADLAACRRSKPSGGALPRRFAAVVLAVVLAAGAGLAWWVARDPLLEGHAALMAGQAERAEEVARARLRENPGDAQAYLLLGNAAWAQADAARALRAWARGVESDPAILEDAELLDALPAALSGLDERNRRHVARAEHVVRLASQKARPGAAPLLGRLAEESPNFQMRREAYEGLERLEATESVDDPFALLLADFETNRSGRCEIKKWYLARLLELRPEQARPLLEKERGRRGQRCLDDLQ